ncbi:MAG: LamG-like jellyroll fold domain-containing protein [Pseudomonadota bacterium]
MSFNPFRYKSNFDFIGDNLADSVFINALPFQSGGWLPTDLTTLRAWYDGADKASLIDGSGENANSGSFAGTLAEWQDKSGNNNHARQTTAANQPEADVRTLNNFNLVTARSGDKYFDVNNFPTMRAAYAVLNLPSTDSLDLCVLVASSNTNNEIFLRHASSGDISFDGTGNGQGKYALNGRDFSALASNHTSPNAPVSGPCILGGFFDVNVNAATFLNRPIFASTATGVDIGEMIYMTVGPTDDEKLLIEGRLAHKWGLQYLLPEDHLYKYDGEIFGYPKLLNIKNTGPLAWYDASDIDSITHTSNSVSQWNDKSGNNNHAIQATSESRPLTNTDKQNNFNVLTFDGVNDFLSLPAGAINILGGAYTVIAVARDNTTVNRRIVNFANSGTIAGLRYKTGAGTVEFSSGSFNGVSGSGFTRSDYNVIVGRREGTTLGVSVNGGAEVTNSLATDAMATSGAIGRFSESNADPLSGTIGEIIIYNRSLTPSEISAIVSSLKKKWGI